MERLFVRESFRDRLASLDVARTSPPAPTLAAPGESPASPSAPSAPGPRPTNQIISEVRRRTAHAEALIRRRIESLPERGRTDCIPDRAPEVPSVVPFGDRPVEQRRADLDAATEAARTSNDMSSLDDVDTFRATLDSEQQVAYDAHLEGIRNDERINFSYEDGAEPDAVLEDIVFRGIAAETFGRPEALDDVLETATRHELDEVPDFAGDDQSGGRVRDVDDGQFDVYVFPAERDLGYAGGAPASGDLTVKADAIYDFLAEGGDNLVVHEFAHAEQGASADGPHDKQYLPAGFPDPAAFDEALASEGVQELLAANGLNAAGLEAYPTIAKLFVEDPAALLAASPELFDLMVEQRGYRPNV